MNKKLLKHFCAVFLAWFMALLLLPQSAQAQEKEAYVVKSSDKKTLTFYYDDQKSSRTGTVWGIEETRMDQYGVTYPAWSGTWTIPESRVTTAVFDNSFKNFLPKTTNSWFCKFTNLEEIKGLENLNTSEVTIMSGMFIGCKKLSQLNLSNFNTKKVVSMKEMFYGCSSLTSLNLSNFNTEKVQNMKYMFDSCSSLTSLNLSNFNIKKVQDMSGMFADNTSLQTIYCNNTWTCALSDEMFYNCTNLKGAVKYNANKEDVSMANPNTGYFTKK